MINSQLCDQNMYRLSLVRSVAPHGSGAPAPAPRPKRRASGAPAPIRGRAETSAHHEEATDSSDYSGGTGTDDSGFSDPRQFLKQHPRHSLPASRRQQNSQSTYYKTLQCSDGAPEYYKSLNREAIPGTRSAWCIVNMAAHTCT